MKHLPRLVTLSALGLLATAAPAQDPEARAPEKPAKATPEQLIQKGLDARRSGKNREAIRFLQSAIAAIQAESAGDLASFLQSALDGWKADDEKPQSGTWNAGGQSFEWSQAKRTYTRESDGARVTVTITSWPQVIQGQRAMLQAFSNPQMLKMMNADENRSITPIEEGSFAGWKTVEKGQRAQAVAIGKSLMVMAECSTGDEKALDRYWASIDFTKLGTVDAQEAK